MKKTLFKIILLFFLFFLFFILCANSYTVAISSNISSSVFRLHVIANSNSTEDQNLKYIVRDNILEYLNTLIDENTSRESIINIISNNVEKFKEIAENTVRENGYGYDVIVETGNYYFPTKKYGDISLPSGNYDGLRIKIGEAQGQNWWCVMFPPLCFVDVSNGVVPDESKEILEDNLEDEEYSIISRDSEEIKFKFKIIEIFENFKQTISKNSFRFQSFLIET